MHICQIIKEILISLKDNPTKYKTQFLNGDFIHERKTAVQTYMALCEVIAP